VIVKLKICFHVEEKERFFPEIGPEALERKLRLAQSLSYRHQAREGQQ